LTLPAADGRERHVIEADFVFAAQPDYDMIDIRMATPDEDEVLVGHYLKIWDSYGTPPEHYRPDAAARILSFHQKRPRGAASDVVPCHRRR